MPVAYIKIRKDMPMTYVGVKAPGKQRISKFLLAAYDAKFTNFGGKP